MTYLQVLSQFLAAQFPDWGDGALSYDVQSRTLSVDCQTAGRRAAMADSAERLVWLDIGVEAFMAIHPDYPDVLIPTVASRCRSHRVAPGESPRGWDYQ